MATMATTDTSATCVVCAGDSACDGMDNMCADCYWNADAEFKKARRSDPVWRYNRICSFAITCMGMDTKSAVAYALKEMNLTAPPTVDTKA
jgi:hypothetical protein